MFCSLSTICVYLTKTNETIDDFHKSVQVIQQMKNNNQILFLVRNEGENEMGEILNEGTRESFIMAKDLLQENWQYIPNISEILLPNSFKIIPYGNLHDSNIFNSVLWNNEIEMLNIIHNSNIPTKERLLDDFEKNIETFFVEIIDNISTHINFPPHIQNSLTAKRIYAISLDFLVQIDDAFINLKEKKASQDEKNQTYIYIYIF